MTAQAIYDRVRLRPFKPYRLVTLDGNRYDVWQLGMMLVSKDRVIVGVYGPGENPNEELPNRTAVFSPLDVAHMEDLPTGG